MNSPSLVTLSLVHFIATIFAAKINFILQKLAKNWPKIGFDFEGRKFWADFFQSVDTWGMYNKTFYGRNLRIFVIS